MSRSTNKKITKEGHFISRPFPIVTEAENIIPITAGLKPLKTAFTNAEFLKKFRNFELIIIINPAGRKTEIVAISAPKKPCTL